MTGGTIGILMRGLAGVEVISAWATGIVMTVVTGWSRRIVTVCTWPRRFVVVVMFAAARSHTVMALVAVVERLGYGVARTTMAGGTVAAHRKGLTSC